MSDLYERCQAICDRCRSESDQGFERDAQDINESIMRSYLIIQGMRIEPLWIETYFGTEIDHGNCHCRKAQANRFGKLYYHTKGYGGVDLVLSTNEDIYFSILLKACRIEGKTYSQIEMRNYLRKRGIPEDTPVQLEPREGQISIRHCPRINVKINRELKLAAYQLPDKHPKSIRPETIYRYVLGHTYVLC